MILLAPYWLITLRRRTALFGDHSAKASGAKSEQLERTLNAKPTRLLESHRRLHFAKDIAGSLLIVAFGFFLAGGLAFDRSIYAQGAPITRPYVLVAPFGWSLFALSAAAVHICEGLDAITVQAALARPIPPFTRERLMLGAESTRFGILRIVVACAFLAVFALSLVILYLPAQFRSRP